MVRLTVSRQRRTSHTSSGHRPEIFQNPLDPWLSVRASTSEIGFSHDSGLLLQFMQPPVPHINPSKFLIDLTRSFDRVYWRHQLRVSLEQLAAAVEAVGPEATRVREYVESHRIGRRVQEV